MTDMLRCVPGQHWMGTRERRSFNVNVGAEIAAPIAACVVIKQSGSDLSASLLSGSTTISGCIITTPCIVDLSGATDYTVVVRFESTAASAQTYFVVTGVAL